MLQQSLAARRAVIADIEKESKDKTGLRSDVVTLYEGGSYQLYRFKRYTDVRVVFAPEQEAHFTAATRTTSSTRATTSTSAFSAPTKTASPPIPNNP